MLGSKPAASADGRGREILASPEGHHFRAAPGKSFAPKNYNCLISCHMVLHTDSLFKVPLSWQLKLIIRYN